MRLLINERRNPETGASLMQSDMQAGDNGQEPNAGYDLTQTVPKSVAILWAFADPSTRTTIEECLHEASRMTINYFEREYASTRAGQGGVASVKCDGVAGFAFDHYDSRDGDPHPHTHMFISNRVRRSSDQQWTALDGRKIYASTVELAEYNSNLVRDLLTQRLGWAWHETPNTNGTKSVVMEVEGVPDELIDLFSSRHGEIANETRRRVQEEEQRTGQPVDWRRRAEIDKQVWFETRKEKPDVQPSLADKHAHWERKLATEAPGQSIQAMWDSVNSHRAIISHLDNTTGQSATIRLTNQLADHQQPFESYDQEKLAAQAYETISAAKTTWSRSNIRAEAQRLLAGIRLDPAQREQAVNRIADLAMEHCVKITPTRYRVAETLQDPALVIEQGHSVFDDPNLDRYTSQQTLDMERHMMNMFDHEDPLAWRKDSSRSTLETVQDQDRPLSDDQMKAAIHLLENNGRITALIGPAGTGKTTTMRAVTRAWKTTGGDVLGLCLSARARDELADSIESNAITIAQLRVNMSPENTIRINDTRRELACRLAAAPTPEARDRIRRSITAFDVATQSGRIHAGQLVIVDEAGMVNTRDLHEIGRLCEQAGARLILSGDPKQLDAPEGPTGLLAWAERTGRNATLTSIWRFRSDPELWKGDAEGLKNRWPEEGANTLRLREGGQRDNPASIADCRNLIDAYEQHGRLHWGEDDQCETDAYRNTIRWQKLGKSTLLVAGTNEQVRDLNRRTILERRIQGLSDADPNRWARLSDGLDIGKGDRIVNRRPNKDVTSPEGRKIENGMTFTVEQVEARTLVCRDENGMTWNIPRAWAEEACEAGYATTIHRTQGMTVDKCAVVIPSNARTPLNLLYVAATRGREENHLFYACKNEEDRRLDHELYGTETDPHLIARERMLNTLLTHPDNRTATETLHDENADRYGIKRLIDEHAFAGGLIAGPHLIAQLRRNHNNGEIRMIETSPSYEWLRATWARAYMTDHRRALAIINRPIKPKELKANHPSLEQTTPYALRTARKHMPEPAAADQGKTGITIKTGDKGQRASIVSDQLDRLGIPHTSERNDTGETTRIIFDRKYAPAADALIATHINNKTISATAITDWKEFDQKTRLEYGKPIGTPKAPKGHVDYAAVLAGRLSAGLLDRTNGVVRDDWIAGIIPPIKASKRTATLDIVKQNEHLIEQAAKRLTTQAERNDQPWAVEARRIQQERNDPNLMRDIAVYRGMWNIQDQEHPIGERPAGGSGRQEQHWCNIQARLTGQGTGIVNPGRGNKTRRTHTANGISPKPRVKTTTSVKPDTAHMQGGEPWNKPQEPSPSSSYDGPSI